MKDTPVLLLFLCWRCGHRFYALPDSVAAKSHRCAFCKKR